MSEQIEMVALYDFVGPEGAKNGALRGLVVAKSPFRTTPQRATFLESKGKARRVQVAVGPASHKMADGPSEIKQTANDDNSADAVSVDDSVLEFPLEDETPKRRRRKQADDEPSDPS